MAKGKKAKKKVAPPKRMIASAVAHAVANRPTYACTHGDGKCLRWKWDEADQYWTLPAGTCDCADCQMFLDQDAHALTLASALASAKPK
jgi:hypothetical protein